MKKASIIMALLLLLLFPADQIRADKILLKNATLFAKDGSYRAQSYLIRPDPKCSSIASEVHRKTGRMR